MMKLIAFTHLMTSFAALRDSQRGILFNFDRKILLGERYINAEFVLPFPSLNASLQNYLDKVAATLDDLWKVDTNLCQLNFTRMSKSNLTIEWILKQTRYELQLAKRDWQRELIKSAQTLLTPADTKRTSFDRATRVAPITFAAGAGLFGLGLSSGSTLSCALTSILGSCSAGDSNLNKQALLQTVDHVNKMQKRWSQVQDRNNQRLFVLASTLTHLRRQDEITNIQNDKNKQIEEQMKTFNANIHKYRNCHQYFYTRTSLNHNLISLQGIQSTLHTIAKSFRVALYTFQSNLFQNLGHMANGFLPMALFPKEQLTEVLEAIGRQQLHSTDMLSLAIPISKVLSFYEIPLLKSVLSNEIGIIFTLAIPMATKSTVLNVYNAKTIPIPTNGSHAIRWEIESEYIAVTENRHFAAILTPRDLENCIGSVSYSVCQNGFSLQKNKDSCIATLLFQDEYEALENCRVKSIQLPRKEKAENLGYGRWLITSANPDFLMTERPSNSTG